MGRWLTVLLVMFSVSAHAQQIVAPQTAWHYTPNDNFSGSTYLPAKLGYNVADVSSTGQMAFLPTGVKALVYLGYSAGNDATFRALIATWIPYASQIIAFYLADEPSDGLAANFKAESDYIHATIAGSKTFIVLLNNSSNESPLFSYGPANTDIDYFGLDPYPIQQQFSGGQDMSIIAAAVNAAFTQRGITAAMVIPTYQAFGGVQGQFYTYTPPNQKQLIALLAAWQAVVPTPAWDNTYSWGGQNNDISLAVYPPWQDVFSRLLLGHPVCP